MRKDMHKLIKERGASGGGWVKIKPVRLDVDPDTLVYREPMTPRSGGWNLKEQHDRRAPLRRYLASQVGRKWDDVYSEICAVNDHRSKTQRDLLEAIDGIVERHITIVDGEPKDSLGYSVWSRDFWVHPETGILMAPPPAKRYRWRGWRKEFNQVPIDQNTRYVQVGGVWYLCTFAPFEAAPYRAFVGQARWDKRGVVYDGCFREELSWSYDKARETLSREWGACVYVAHKRQLGSKEAKKVQAQWEALELARDAA